MSMIQLEKRSDGIVIVTLDHPSKPVNTLSPAVVKEFNDTVAPLIDETDCNPNSPIRRRRRDERRLFKMDCR